MNTLEDRVRQALREAAEDISWTDVPQLRLPERAGRGRLARGWRGWPPWLTPLAAAAAVAAVLAATLALTGGPGRSSPHRTGAGRAAGQCPALLHRAARHRPHRGATSSSRPGARRRRSAPPPPAGSWPRSPRRRTARSPWWPPPPACAATCWPRSGEPVVQLRRERSGVPQRSGRPDPLVPAADELIGPGFGAEPAACPGAAGRCGSRRPGAHPRWPQARGGHPGRRAPARPGNPGGHAGHGGSARLDLAGCPADRREPGWHRVGAVLGGGRQHAGLSRARSTASTGSGCWTPRRRAAAWRTAGWP